MKKLIIASLLIFHSCVFDPPFPKLCRVKNNSDSNIVLVYGGDSVSDERLFYAADARIKANSMDTIYGTYPTIEKDKKIHFFFFNEDSVNKFLHANKISGIVSSSFLKNYSINPDSLQKSTTIVFE